MGSATRKNNSSGCSKRRNASDTGNKGFDCWKDEFSGKIRDIEDSLHCNNENNVRPTLHKLLKQARKILPNLLEEVQSVSKRKDPALWQELMDIYQACRMQLETYQSLEELMMGNACSDAMSNGTASSTFSTPSSTAEVSQPTQPSSADLWDEDAMEQRHAGNGNSSSSIQRQKVHASTQGKVSSQNSRLKDALRSLRESQEVATEIAGELEGQRMILENAQSNVHLVKGMTQQAKGLVDTLNKKWWLKW